MSRLSRFVQACRSRSAEWLAAARDRLAVLMRPDRLLLVHMAKTAGTSFRRMLQEEYGPRLVYPGDDHLLRLGRGDYLSGRELLDGFRNLPPHNVLVGHVAASLVDLLPASYDAVVFLRDPVQRTLSLLNHVARRDGTPLENLLRDRHFMTGRVQDFQTRILGADGAADPWDTGDVDDRTLERALGRLDTLAFVGLTERFEESCRRFDARFGTRVVRFLRRDNVQQPMGSELADLIPVVEPLLTRDRALYAAAVKRFDAARG